MSLRIAGFLLISAAALFWLSWLLMPGVGVTDAAQIFELVERQRSLVMLSVITQLISAALYVPALLGISSAYAASPVRWGTGLLLLGAMGSGIDAVFHLLAYAMTMPGLERSSLLKVMSFMQGPGLRVVAPFIASFFVGSIVLSVALRKSGTASRASMYMFFMAVGIALAGGPASSSSYISARAVGLSVLAAVTMAQACIGLELFRHKAALAHAAAG
jgi:hypothetical protein